MKIIIFDFDDTLYNGTVWGNWQNYMKEFFAKTFNKQEGTEFIEKYKLREHNFKISETAKALIQEFGSAEKIVNYTIKNIYPLQAPDLHFIDINFLKKLSKKYPLYIVSNSSENRCLKYLKDNNIDTNIFRGIFTNKFESTDPTKAFCYKHIIEKEGVQPADIMVIGDNYNTDIMPAEQVGCKPVLVKTLEDIYNINFDI